MPSSGSARSLRANLKNRANGARRGRGIGAWAAVVALALAALGVQVFAPAEHPAIDDAVRLGQWVPPVEPSSR